MKYFLLIFLFIPVLLFADNPRLPGGQESKTDSLNRLLPKSEGKERIQLLIGLADAYYSSNPTKALDYGEEAFKISLDQNERELMAKSLNLIGIAHFYSYDFLMAAEYLKKSLSIYSVLGNETEEAKISQNIGLAYLQANKYDSSEIYLQQAYALYVGLSEPKDIAYCNINLGLLNYMKSEYAAALNHYNKASEIYQEIDDPVNYANLLNRIGMTYWSLGINDKALAFVIESVREREKLNDPVKLATGYNNIGAIYHDLAEDEKALEYYKLAFFAYQSAGDSMGMPISLTNIGNVYNRNKKLDTALFYYERALVISEAVGDEFQSAKTRHNIGVNFQKTGQFDNAISYFQDYLNYCSKIGNSEGVATVKLNLGTVYFKMGSYREAEVFLNESVSLADSLNLLPTLKSAYAALSELREVKGDKQAALAYYKLFTHLKDSIYNIEKAKAISEMETKYETEKKENENILLKKNIEIEIRKSTYLIIFAIILIVAGMVSLMLFYFIRRNAINKKKLAESEAARLEDKVAHQKRELASSTLTLSRNLEFINSLIEDIKVLSEHVDDDKAYASISRIIKKLEQQNSDKCWEEFETRFQEIHRHFYQKLHEEFSGLTSNDVKLCALLKMGMNTKEICSVTFQSVRAVEAARLRLRKKLYLDNAENLSVFLQKY